MVETVSRRKLITGFVIAISVLIMLCVWPLKLIRYNYTAKSDEDIARESDPISVEHNMTQIFDGVEGELKSVDLLVCNDMADQTITFRLYDENHEQIYEQFYDVPYDFVAPDFVHIPIRYPFEKGLEYSFIVEGYTMDLYLAYEDRDTTTSPINYLMAYGGAEVPEYDLIVRYNFARPFGVVRSLITMLILVAVCAGTWFGLGMIEDEEVSVKKYVQIVVNPILGICAVASIYIIMIRKLFDTDIVNNLFLLLGVLLLIGVGALLVNLHDISVPEDIKEKLLSIPLRRIIRVIAIATVIWYCYEYVNGLFDIHHAYSTAKVFIAFCFVLFSTYSKKEIFNIPNLIWLIIGPICGYFVYKPMIGVYEIEELYKYYGWLVAVGGFVVINLVISIALVILGVYNFKKIDLRFAIPFSIFAIGIIVLSNGRDWPWKFVLMCVLLIFRLCVMKNSKYFIKDLCSGVILNFYMLVWYCLRHRPYYFYQFYRYNMVYHTVTVTAYHLALVMSASIFRLLDAYRKNKNNLAGIITNMFTFGMAATYVLFTMSRTAFLSVGTTALFAIVGVCILYLKKDQMQYALRVIGIMAISAIYMFPVTFFLTDVMPRISNDPIVYAYEERDFSFKKGMPYSDQYYMTIEQFCSEFGRKVFGITPKREREEAGISIKKHWDNPLVLKAYAATDDYSYDDDVTDMSNGRFDIFKSYMSDWNAWGHDEMGTLLPNGEIAIHAHNSFLQVAHDHGVVFGAYFLLFVAYSFFLSFIKAFESRKSVDKFYVSVIIVAFGMASLVEWVFHACNPMGWTTIMAMMTLIIKDKRNEESN